MDEGILKKEQELSKSLNLVIDYIREKKYNEAKKILNDYLDMALPLVEENETNRFFSFRDTIEFYAAVRILGLNKNATWTKFKVSYVYNLLMFIANEEKEFEKAQEYAKKAIYFNPMDSNLYFELSETYKYLKDYDAMFLITKESYKVLFDNRELARYYRNLGFYYSEKEKYKLAFALYLISLNFDVNETAYHEIGYIREKLQDKKYTLSNEEMMDIIKKENIEYGIPSKNRKILEDFIKENEDKQESFALVQEAKSMLNKTEVVLNDPNYLLTIPIMPVIDSTDMFDQDKIKKDEIDKKIEKENSKKVDIGIKELKGLPTNSSTTLKPMEEIIKRMISEYVIATTSLFALENKNDLIPLSLEQMDNKFDIKRALDLKDFTFITKITDGKIPRKTLEELSWMLESVNIYMYALSLTDGLISQEKECDTTKIDKLFLSLNGYDDLVKKCKLRSKEELLSLLDLTTRYEYLITSKFIKGENSNINPFIIREQKAALEWILSFRLENLMKEYITINYKKNEFKFSFKIPSSIHIKELVNLKKPKNIISLVSDQEEAVITFVNHLSKDLDKLYEDSVKEYINFGWNKVKEEKFENDLGKVNKVVLNVILQEGVQPEFGIVKYYFKLNGNVISIETLLERDTDYKNVEKSKNNKIALDILNSIKVID